MSASFPVRTENFIIYDPAFYQVIGRDSVISTVAETSAHEGPVYYKPQNALYYTSVPEDSNLPLKGDKSVVIGRIALDSGTVETFRAHSNMANGMTLDGDRLLVCEQGSLGTHARISAIDLTVADAPAVTLTDAWDGLRFNSPNDIVVKDDGTIWFTDPSYGFLQGFKNQPQLGEYLYRYDPESGYVTAVGDGFSKPNGVAFSPDFKTLYLTDSGAIQGPDTYFVDKPHHVVAFDVDSHNNLRNRRLLAIVNPGIPDGIKCDSEGRIYTSSATGVKVYQPCGTLLGEILAAGVANFTFGGPDNNLLYLCVDTAVLVVNLQATGAR